MRNSESIVNLSKALFKFQSRVNSIKKEANNPFFKSKYASLSNILDEIDGCLIDAGLVIIQPPVESPNESMVTVSTMILHAESGEFMESTFSMAPAKKDPQGYGSCITYMRRYALTSILKLNVEDDDGNEASNTKEKVRYSEPVQQRKLSIDFQDLKTRIELSESIQQLIDLAPEISAKIKYEEEKEMLRKIYSDSLKRFKAA